MPDITVGPAAANISSIDSQILLILDKKSQFIIDNYHRMSRTEILKELNEPFWWVKKKIASLLDQGKIQRKREKCAKPLTEKEWPPEVKARFIELRRKYRKNSRDVITLLDKEFGFKISKGAVQGWFKRFNCPENEKQNWLKEYFTKELIESLLFRSTKQAFKDEGIFSFKIFSNRDGS